MTDGARSSRAVEVAARHVERVVAAAETAAEQIRERARQEADELRAAAAREAEELREAAAEEREAIRASAAAEAQARVEEARGDARRVEERAREEAEALIEAARRAADEALAEARAVTSGLRRLGQTLEAHAERILADVTAAHRELSADLRVAVGLEPVPRPRADRDRGAARRSPGPADARPARRASGAGRPAGDDIDLPSWVERQP